MGISSDGQLNYGWSFDVEQSWHVKHEYPEQWEGWKACHEPIEDNDEDDDYDDLTVLSDYENYSWSKEQSGSCLAISSHCSYDYSMPLITHKEFDFRNSRGYVEEIDFPSAETIERWRKELIAEADRLGFDVEKLGEPKMMLTSMYG